tara:strand:+ start:512 stop:664 length:153 start_codon:yes stop_codon:yes gene_type:complete
MVGQIRENDKRAAESGLRKGNAKTVKCLTLAKRLAGFENVRAGPDRLCLA